MTELSKSKYMMIVSNHLSGIRYKLQQTEFMVYTYLIFLSGFFLSPNNHLHRNFFYLFLIAPFLICLNSRLLNNCIRSNLFKLSLLFLMYFWISMFWTNSQLSSEEYYDLTRYLIMSVIFIMATMTISDDPDHLFDKIKFWLCMAALIASVVFIALFYYSHDFPAAQVSGPYGYTQNPNQAAMYFGFVGIIAFNSMIFSSRKSNKVFYGVVFAILVSYMLLSQSRGPLFAFIVSLVLGLVFEKRWKGIIAIITACAVFIVLVESVGIGMHSMIGRGFANRIDIFLVTLNRISQAPLLGEGYFTDVSILTPLYLESSPHNLLLLVTLKSGFIGGFLLITLVLASLIFSYKKFLASGNWIYVCLFVYFIGCMTFDSTHLLHKPTLGWLIFWMPVALIAAEEVRGAPSLKSRNL